MAWYHFHRMFAAAAVLFFLGGALWALRAYGQPTGHGGNLLAAVAAAGAGAGLIAGLIRLLHPPHPRRAAAKAAQRRA